MSVIFLAGVHGVGKGFLGAPVAKKLGVCHMTASQLIREEKGHASWDLDKRVSQPDDNQVALIRALSRRRVEHQDILLDGHFALRGISGNIVRLAQEVFSELQLSGVILLTEDLSTICQRLSERDGTAVNAAEVEELIAVEARHAQEVCCKLHLPLSILYKPTISILIESVSHFLNQTLASNDELSI